MGLHLHHGIFAVRVLMAIGNFVLTAVYFFRIVFMDWDEVIADIKESSKEELRLAEKDESL